MDLAYPFLAAYILDLAFGDPPAWPHPVRLMGHLCTFWEGALYRPSHLAGAFFFLAVLGSTLSLLWLALRLAGDLPFLLQGAVAAYLLYTGLATRSLHLESRLVEEALRAHDLPLARQRLSMIVSRDTGHLDEEGIRRAVLETVAENLADGVVGPMFWTVLLGLPGMFLYKAVSTMDSMVGYKNQRYAHFGGIAARADDVLNFLPARLTAALMVPAAALLGLNWRETWRLARRDAGKTKSPNAGWPEAALAGALGVQLAGPSTYFGQTVDKAWLGDPGPPLTARHYTLAVRLLYATSLLMAGITLGLLK
jgi:adenosylcobinamide-phosphate synthase